MIMFIGGQSSGKSVMAEAWAEGLSAERLYLALCQPADDEMRERVARHRARRGAGWRCVEESLEPLAALELFLKEHPSFQGPVLIESLDMLLNNLLGEKLNRDNILNRIESLLEGLGTLSLPCALISSECGLGILPPNPLARLYVDLLGIINQQAARLCENVILVSCGLPFPLKGALPFCKELSNAKIL